MKRAPKRVKGVSVNLRFVTIEDAEYIFKLRTDPILNKFLSAVNGSVEDQRSWIEAYKARELEGSEYYYVIEHKDGERCGVFRIYDIQHRQGSFTWGSWILDHNKSILATLECLLLVHAIGFEYLGLQRAHYDAMRDRTTLAFYRRFAEEIRTDDEKEYFVYTAERFAVDRVKHLTTLTWEADDGEDD